MPSGRRGRLFCACDDDLGKEMEISLEQQHFIMGLFCEINEILHFA